jgi:hypothetical protein
LDFPLVSPSVGTFLMSVTEQEQRFSIACHTLKNSGWPS